LLWDGAWGQGEGEGVAADTCNYIQSTSFNPQEEKASNRKKILNHKKKKSVVVKTTLCCRRGLTLLFSNIDSNWIVAIPYRPADDQLVALRWVTPSLAVMFPLSALDS